MASNSKSLSLVSSNYSVTGKNKSEISAIKERWYAIENLLSEFYADEDKKLSLQNDKCPEMDEIIAKIVAAEREQRTLLYRLALLPALTMEDVIAKLSIWKSITMPAGADDADSQPTDVLVSSAFDDILSGVVGN